MKSKAERKRIQDRMNAEDREWKGSKRTRAMRETTQAKFDELAFIMDYEGGEIDDEETIVAGFQALIDSGTVWGLQGTYGRTAARLIQAGYCEDTHGRLAN